MTATKQKSAPAETPAARLERLQARAAELQQSVRDGINRRDELRAAITEARVLGHSAATMEQEEAALVRQQFFDEAALHALRTTHIPRAMLSIEREDKEQALAKSEDAVARISSASDRALAAIDALGDALVDLGSEMCGLPALLSVFRIGAGDDSRPAVGLSQKFAQADYLRWRLTGMLADTWPGEFKFVEPALRRLDAAALMRREGEQLLTRIRHQVAEARRLAGEAEPDAGAADA